jgi:hypothetical protein
MKKAAVGKFGVGLNRRSNRRAFDESDAAEDVPSTHQNSFVVAAIASQAAKSELKAKQLQQEALQQDATTFDYDGVYDSLKAKEKAAKLARTEDSQKPKYMAALLRSAQIRQIDRLRANETKAKRERETEGEEFADKEAFVTTAYREALEEAKRLEAQDALQEANERNRSKGAVAPQFFKTILDKREELHRNLETLEVEVPNKDDTKEGNSSPKSTQSNSDTQNLIDKGINLNASGEIVDKRQLLTAGLNVVRKPKPAPPIVTPSKRGVNDDSRRAAAIGQSKVGSARHSAILMEQYQDKAKEEKAKEDEVAAKFAKRNTEQTISDARERYLARKKAAAAKLSNSTTNERPSISTDDMPTSK